MTLPSSPNSIAKSQVNVELGRSSGAQILLGETAVRNLAGVPSGQIAMSNLRGKSFFSVTGGTTSVSGSGGTFEPDTVTVTTTTASVGTVSGGAAPLSYLWQYVSGDAAFITSSTSASTTFSRSEFVNSSTGVISRSGVYRCRITDNSGNIIYGPNCSVSTTHSYFGIIN